MGPTDGRTLVVNLTTAAGERKGEGTGQSSDQVPPSMGDIEVVSSLNLPLSGCHLTSQRVVADSSRCRVSLEKVKAVTERGQWRAGGRRTCQVFRVRVLVN